MLWWLLQFFLALLVLYWTLRFFLDYLLLPHLHTRHVFITGCDSGFGRELAVSLAERGLPVFAGCLTADGATKLGAETRGLPGEVRTVLINVTDQTSVERAVEQVKKALAAQHGQLWAIVNNAGVFATYGPDEWLTLREYEEALSVNVLGVIRVTQAFRPLLKQSKGRVVTVASSAGRFAFASGGPYCVSKFACIAYMDVIRNELRHFGITCHTLEPGIFRTSLIEEDAYEKRLNFAFNRLSKETKDYYGKGYVRALMDVWRRGFLRWASSRTEWVTKAYMHALTARFPHTRYVVGLDARFLWQPLSQLPSAVQDGVVTLLMFLGQSSIPKPPGLLLRPQS